jgi:hypothetical protein
MIDGGSSWEKKDRQSAATFSEGRRRTFHRKHTDARRRAYKTTPFWGFVYSNM